LIGRRGKDPRQALITAKRKGKKETSKTSSYGGMPIPEEGFTRSSGTELGG